VAHGRSISQPSSSATSTADNVDALRSVGYVSHWRAAESLGAIDAFETAHYRNWTKLLSLPKRRDEPAETV
jgi:hypothetical protein